MCAFKLFLFCERHSPKKGVKPDTQGVEVGRGDELLGDTLRSTLAEITAQVCELDRGVNMDFAVVNVKGDAPGDGEVESLLQSLDE